MNKWLRYLLIAILFLGLVLVRVFENELFYDPFLKFFKGDYLHKDFPDYDLSSVSINIVYRYLLNSVLTLSIIGLLFWEQSKLKFTAIVLVVFLVVLLPIYLYFIETEFSLGSNIGFYIRRFLIQPLLLLILIPAFFYQKHLNQNKIQ